MGEGMVTWVGEIVTVSIPSISLCHVFCDGIIRVHNSEGGRVGYGCHVGLLPLLLAPVQDEEHQKKEDKQEEDHNPHCGSNLVGINWNGCTGPAKAVEVSNDNNASLVTP